MYPELNKVINEVQKSNTKADKGLVCRALQSYYKILQQAGAVTEESADDSLLKEIARLKERIGELELTLEDNAVEFSETIDEPEEQEDDKKKPLSQMNRNELVIECGELGIELIGEETKVDMKNMIAKTKGA